MELEDVGYEILRELYVDTLLEDYELRIGGGNSDDLDIAPIVARFHEAANKILADLPDTVGKLEVAETI